MRKLTALAAVGALMLTGCGIISPKTPTTGADTAALVQCLNDSLVTPSSLPSENDNSKVKLSDGFPANAKIGIALPQKTSQNWVEAEGMFNTALTTHGFTPIVKFATGGVSDQQLQITDMINQGVSVLVVGAVDVSQLGTQLDAAKADGIIVISYDRLLTQTRSVDLYVAYDNYQVGQLQGQSLVQGLLATQGSPPYNIELIAGSLDDSNSQPFFEGAMSVLQTGISCGALVVPSGQTTLDQVATQGWLASNVQKRMNTLLASYYTDTPLNGVLSPNDTLARAAIASLSSVGRSDDHTVITGQDSETMSIPLIMKGTQYMTIYKNTQGLVNEVVRDIGWLQQGLEVPVTDAAGMDNGVITVPADLLTPQAVTAANAAKVYANDPERIGCTQDPPVNCQ